MTSSPCSFSPDFHLRFILFLIFVPFWSPASCALFNRFSPQWDKPETVTMVRKVPIKIELLAHLGTDEQMKVAARKAILDVFTGAWPTTGDESNFIGETMEKRFGGVWMVSVFDIDFDAAYTIVRRSPSYMLFGVNNRAVLVAREGNGKRQKGNSILIRRRRVTNNN